MSNIPNIKVTGLHPKLMEAISATLNEAKARGLTVAVNSGLRTAEEQELLYAKGRTVPGDIVTNGRAYESWHNYGLAADIVFKDSKGNWTWNKKDSEWEELGKIGELFGMEWGGRWPRFKDMPHFQMRGFFKTVAEAKVVLFRDGIEAVWEKI